MHTQKLLESYSQVAHGREAQLETSYEEGMWASD
jgi:hypothetical protein